MKKFRHRGGVVGRRTRALNRLQKVKNPNKRELKEIDILEKKITDYNYRDKYKSYANLNYKKNYM